MHCKWPSQAEKGKRDAINIPEGHAFSYSKKKCTAKESEMLVEKEDEGDDGCIE